MNHKLKKITIIGAFAYLLIDRLAAIAIIKSNDKTIETLTEANENLALCTDSMLTTIEELRSVAYPDQK